MNKHETIIEDFFTTIKNPDINLKELSLLRSSLHSAANVRQGLGQMVTWYNLVKSTDSNCQLSRLHHFLIGSSVPLGVCRVDDLSGNLSVQAFLRASTEERQKMIEQLRVEAETGVPKAA